MMGRGWTGSIRTDSDGLVVCYPEPERSLERATLICVTGIRLPKKGQSRNRHGLMKAGGREDPSPLIVSLFSSSLFSSLPWLLLVCRSPVERWRVSGPGAGHPGRKTFARKTGNGQSEKTHQRRARYASLASHRKKRKKEKKKKRKAKEFSQCTVPRCTNTVLLQDCRKWQLMYPFPTRPTGWRPLS